MIHGKYIPALRFGFLTRFYDPLVRLTTREFAFKRALLAQANLQNKQTILDLACGTGTLSVWIKKLFPESKIFAFDVDREILQMARSKANKFQTEINFEQGFSDDLPFPDQRFDRVFSTLSFHHLTLERKIKTLGEVWRVLKPDGEFHLADYALPRSKAQFVLSKSVRLIDGFASTHDNLRGRLGILMEQNGFSDVQRTLYFKTILGTIRLFKAIK
ncbi:MAG: class I SAM-dependent methyltransferase [Pyrinomonadaceae bacterium]